MLGGEGFPPKAFLREKTVQLLCPLRPGIEVDIAAGAVLRTGIQRGNPLPFQHDVGQFEVIGKETVHFSQDSIQMFVCPFYLQDVSHPAIEKRFLRLQLLGQRQQPVPNDSRHGLFPREAEQIFPVGLLVCKKGGIGLPAQAQPRAQQVAQACVYRLSSHG